MTENPKCGDAVNTNVIALAAWIVSIRCWYQS